MKDYRHEQLDEIVHTQKVLQNPAMHKVKIWIDVEQHTANATETLCTLFADHQISMRPLAGEVLSFHQTKGSALEFSVVSPIGSVRSNIVSTEIENIRHYAVNSNGVVVYKTAIQCAPIVVPTRDDAHIVCKLLTEQLGFEVDPYTINLLT